MKLRHVHIENFKGVKNLDISLADRPDDTPRRMTCLIGDNGSGKTTVLQAIALAFSLATKRTRSPSEFRWHGFLPERVGSLGRTVVELILDFDHDESLLIRQIYNNNSHLEHASLSRSMKEELGWPIVDQIRINYRNNKLHIDTVNNPRHIINWILNGHFDIFFSDINSQDNRQQAKLGNLYWFDQYRDIGAIFPKPSKPGSSRVNSKEGWGAGVEQLRESLVGWWAYYASDLDDPNKNAIKDLERQFAILFPGTRFRGMMPRNGVIGPGVKDFYFLLERGGRQYDLAEMASGEQAVFSLLYDFVRLKIAKSIVLIDELELHLHPPAQQALYAALPKLGEDCQFLVTTHSDYLAGVIPDEYKVRLEGGRPCL